MLELIIIVFCLIFSYWLHDNLCMNFVAGETITININNTEKRSKFKFLLQVVGAGTLLWLAYVEVQRIRMKKHEKGEEVENRKVGV